MILKPTPLLTPSQKRQIARIWNDEYPQSISFADESGFDLYLDSISNPSHFLLEDEKGDILAWACTFTREQEKWFAVILDETIQGKGFGSQIMTVIKQGETQLSAWVIDNGNSLKRNGENYKSPMDFYLKNGFEVLREVRLGNEKISGVKIVWKR